MPPEIVKATNLTTMSFKIFRTVSLMAIILALLSCRNEHETSVETHSAYYWSTTWELDSAQRAFLEDNEVSRIYLRYFDVVIDQRGEVMPNATLRFADSIPQGVEIIPTVFIVNDCLTQGVDSLGLLILNRVLQMSETHDVAGVKEIQIDCDWSKRTQDAYFSMLRQLRDAAHAKGLRVSATIRLHQLSQEVPPVDHGVLMMYNTGDVRKLEKNPILDMDDAAPYMHHIKGYDLPLSTAYPIFSWQILVRANRYAGIIHGDDDLAVLPGDTVITHEVSLDTVLAVRDAIGRLRADANNEIILFDISKNNIQRIKQTHYEKIYHP